MAAFHSIHLGLNKVSPEHYSDLQDLRAAVNDAMDWSTMASEVFGYEHQEVLINEQATATALLQRLETLAGSLEAGDALLITYSGHGGQLADALSSQTGDEETDETWCLYDRQLIDDEVYNAFARFRAGVRITVIADCCHSGTSIRADDGTMSAEEIARLQEEQAIEAELETAGYLPRKLSLSRSASIFAEFFPLYQSIRESLPASPPEVTATVQLFAACQDEQVTYDGRRNGIFTEAFKSLVYSGEYRNLTGGESVLKYLRHAYKYPKPNYMAYGGNQAALDTDFPLMARRAPASAQQPAAPAPVRDVRPETPQETDRPTSPVQSEYKIGLGLAAGGLTEAAVRTMSPAGAANIQVDSMGAAATLTFPAARYPSVWEPAHHIARQADAQGLDLDVEPVAMPAFPVEDDNAIAREAGQEFGYLPYWPPVTEQQDPPIGWHLDNEHSQLAAARDYVWEKIKTGELRETVRIAHLDTGWYPTQPALAANPHIRRDLTRSFLDKEKGINQVAVDLRYKDGEQHGHGAGTLGILAGWSLPPDHTDGRDAGFIGGIPFAEVVPLRIADNVLIFDTHNFCDALEYAMENGCEVVTMSMGGKPSRRMADTINKAYEKGITIVTAAGNNMAKGISSIGPRTVVWPARFQRVLAACGACHNHLPYDFAAQEKYGSGMRSFDIRSMQGNWGPAKAMHKALAAYSPNIPWLAQDEKQPVKKSGGGTSAVTPQIAAAAGLWITLHKAELKRRGYAGTWKQVEAVREALFGSADKSFAESKKYYGNGILRALDALHAGVPEITDSHLAEKAESSKFGIPETLGMFLNRRRAADAPGPALRRSLERELLHLLLDDPETAEMDQVGPDDSDRIRDAINRAAYCSEDLRACVGG